MSKIWSALIIISIVVAFMTGNPGKITESLMEQANNAVQNIITLAGMLCFWNGIFHIFEKTEAVNKLAAGIRRVISKIFDKDSLSDKAVEYMSLNITTNVLGVGNAATVHGIKAIEELQKKNLDKDIPNDNMTTFILINTASLQLIPTSMIAMRSMYGSSDPAGILLPVWIVTIVALIIGLTSIKLLNRWVK